jgi:septal ring factor EnvC (AmiA/AmiB activator)
MGRAGVACHGGLAAALMLILAFSSALAEEGEIRQKEGELRQLQSRITELQTDLSQSEKREQVLVGELRELERKIGRQAGNLRRLSGQQQEQESKLARLAGQRDRQRSELESHRLALTRQIRTAYAMGRQERIKILLNQQDPALVGRMMVYYDYFNRARTEAMGKIASALKSLQTTEEQLLAEQQNLDRLLEHERREKALLDRTQEERQGIIASLRQDIRSKNASLDRFRKDEKQLKDLLGRLQEELAPIPLESLEQRPFKSEKGRLAWPAGGRLSASFGTSRGGNLKWDGVMISAPEGREVRAVHHGRVAFADWLRGFGMLLIVDHGDGYMTLYGHNQSLFKEAGEWVAAGETLALVGSSGGQESAGVYFGIRHNGRPLNPKKWCRKARGKRVG